MSIIRPTAYGLWASGASGNVVEPIAADKAQGFLPTGIARSSYANWLWSTNGQWNQLVGEVFQPNPPVGTQDLPQLALRGPSGASGTSRWSVDHLGNPIGMNIGGFREGWDDWHGGFTAISGRAPEHPRWGFASTGLATVGVINPVAGYPLPVMDLSLGATAGDRITMSTERPWVQTGVSGTIIAIVADVAPQPGTAVSGNITTIFGVAGMTAVGLRDVFPVVSGVSGFNTIGYVWFRRPQGLSAWLAEVATGISAISSINTGIPPKQESEGGQQLRVEICAADTPYFGGQPGTRFLIDGILCATGPAYQRAGNVLAAARTDIATGVGAALFVGPIELAVNKRK